MSSVENNINLQRLRDLIQHIGIGMLTTVEEGGTLHSRPMATRALDNDAALWFFTYESAHKVDEVARHQQVNISYALPGERLYASVSGTAELCTDRLKMQELWDESLKAWFPAGLSEPDLALLRVMIEHAEFWDELHSTSPLAVACRG
jgi:general stress protein 26